MRYINIPGHARTLVVRARPTVILCLHTIVILLGPLEMITVTFSPQNNYSQGARIGSKRRYEISTVACGETIWKKTTLPNNA